MFDKELFEKFKRREAIVVPKSEEEAKAFVKLCFSQGIKWCASPITSTFYSEGKYYCNEDYCNEDYLMYGSLSLLDDDSLEHITYNMMFKENFNVDLFEKFRDGEIAIQVETRFEARDFVDLCYENNIQWSMNKKNETHYDEYGTTCYHCMKKCSLKFCSKSKVEEYVNSIISYKDLKNVKAAEQKIYIPAEDDYVFNGVCFVNKKGEQAF